MSQILILGGTAWLGAATARAAREAGHDVTCLARGESGAVPDGVRLVATDRWQPDAYAEVAGQDWDAVVEVSWQPVLVRGALEALAKRAAHWSYVSSGSVYADLTTLGTALHEPWRGEGEVSIEEYGPAKVACEEAAREHVAEDRLLLARAGLIGGYGDGSDRFGYWPARIDRATPGERVLTPPEHAPFQVIDVEDLASWLARAAVEGATGAHDVVGDRQTFGHLVELCAAASETEVQPVPVTEEWLVSHEVRPWSGPESLAMWLPAENVGMASRDNASAKAHGLRVRPLADTVASALRWERERGLDRERRSGLSANREGELLALVGD